MGILVWPAGLLLILLSASAQRHKLTSAALWGIAAIASGTLYFLGWKSRLLSQHNSWDTPFSLLQSFVTGTGGSLFWINSEAFAAGLLLLTTLMLTGVLLYRTWRWPHNSFWLAVAAFALLNVSAVSYGRIGMGVQTSLAPKYSLFSVLLVIALYIMLVDLLLQAKQRTAPFLVGIVLSCIILATTATHIRVFVQDTPTVFSNPWQMQAFKQQRAFLVYTYPYRSDQELQGLTAAGSKVREMSGFLKQHNFSVFHTYPAGFVDADNEIDLSELSPLPDATLFDMQVTEHLDMLICRRVGT